ncbi:Chloroplastic group IIA intron splicing facilitator CRS1, chloroplastic [Sesamum alatum]|uniref:Chloroplastic group IIA intron splicing facilitator CRS1, chloroplastic n=1 Tax=Sesamum alatum TaxID=300844 RepID=A0AAE1XR24_9LAMI|nr:Chloroplastic group IIA intron splicing facilitator CRS1, chloroplastic [Sesamum alatum]
MSASPSLSHFSNAVSPFPYNPAKIQTPIITFGPPKFNFIAFSSSPTNGSNSTKVEGRSIEHERMDYHVKSSESIPHSGSATKAPTAPWMNGPLLVKPNEIMKFRKSRTNRDSTFGENREHPDLDLTGRVGGGRGKVAMKKIFKGIEKLQETQNLEETRNDPENLKFKFAPGALWGDGDCENGAQVEEKSEEAQESWESNGFDIPLGGIEKEVKLKTMPWERDERMVIRMVKKEKVVTAAELGLDEMLLERLRGEAAAIRRWVKVKKAGVTQAVVDQVCFVWRNNELALLKFDLPLCRNMHRAREIVEMKTGGVVVWCNKDFLAVYRGCNYESGSKNFWNVHRKSTGGEENISSSMNYRNTTTVARVSSDGSGLDEMIREKDGEWESLHMASLYEREADRLLDGLGPRFVDWWMHKPLPVDGDLLPELVPGFETPFRLCPPFTRSKLTDAELTYLRKLARPLPTHFVLGRNRKLQGLAAAILKLWEKCHIAKIALKWGIPNTDNEQMANELKNLTGGVLLLRNKFLIILYRGKDFVSSEVAKVVAEREMELTRCQLQEEAARLKASEAFSITDEDSLNSGIVGTLSEFQNIQSEIGNQKERESEIEVQLEAEQERLEKELKDQERKLYILKKKIEKSAKILEKLKNASRFSEQDPDLEIISKEERQCLRAMGLKIDSSLVLGRRGVYDGVIEGIHQHWKHREIVKVITMQKKLSQVMHTAKCLEAESGGILVNVVKLKEGHAIILYRGKNYKRPKSAAQNLLNKREALSRSLELQRLGSLKFFANQREQAIRDLKSELAELLEKKN